jgi:effector-binding domain-containing protein
MNIIQQHPVNFLCFRTTTTIAELPAFAPVTQQVISEAVRLSIPITGAAHWHYFGLTDMNKPFTLEIAIPVGKIVDGYDGAFHFKRTDKHDAVSAVHYGSWLQLPETYNRMFAFIQEQGRKPAEVIREIYINVDFDAPQANVTEIQIGLD